MPQALAAARKRRLMRLRSGELPVFLVTVKPTPGIASATAMACSEKPERPARAPLLALRNSDRLRSGRNPALEGAAVIAASGLKPRGACGRERGGD